jgi:hypothetical protein
MENIIERIAHYADIDTRRAMGFPPRRLFLPELDLKMNSDWNQDGIIIFNTCQVALRSDEISWIFGLDDFFRTSRHYLFGRDNGRVTFYAMRTRRMIHSWHPDFNRDGSFKRARLEL